MKILENRFFVGKGVGGTSPLVGILLPPLALLFSWNLDARFGPSRTEWYFAT
jgi:hypothetical protein